jgi:16S rRNA processing protein RimM
MELVTVGRILRPHGIRGLVRMLSYSDDPTRLESVDRVFLDLDALSERGLRVVGYRGACVLLQLEGVETRSDAETLRGVCVQASVQDLPPLADGEYFAHDILGLEVATTDDQVVGHVVDVVSLPASDMYVVDTGTKQVFIPAVKEIVRSVDVGAGRMVVKPPPGLLDL